LDLNVYQEKAARTINTRNHRDEIMRHALHGMCAEVGEVHSIWQKYYQGHDINDREVMLEVGDLLWMIAEFCTANGWSMSEVAEQNILKLEKRYPNGFDAERSLHREE